MMNSLQMSRQSSYLLAIAMLATTLQLASYQPAYSAPIENGQSPQQDDFSDDLSDLDDNLSPARGRSGLQQQQQLQDELTGLTSNDFAASLQGDQYPMSQAGSSLGLTASARGELSFGKSKSNNNNYNNNNNNDEDSDSDDGDSDIESSNSDQPMQLAPASGRRQQSEMAALQSDNEAPSSWSQNDNEGSADEDDSGARGDQQGDGEPHGLDSNIANAKIEVTPTDMAPAAGHHYHHGHGVHGWLEMGAKTGKKGAFKWHDKHPVGGKGRR